MTLAARSNIADLQKKGMSYKRPEAATPSKAGMVYQLIMLVKGVISQDLYMHSLK